jgi:hypothetical protein
MEEFSTVFTVKIDISNFALNAKDAADINEETIKDYLANMMNHSGVDGISIVEVGKTVKTSKYL